MGGGGGGYHKYSMKRPSQLLLFSRALGVLLVLGRGFWTLLFFFSPFLRGEVELSWGVW